MLKYALKKAQLDFTGVWVTEEEVLEQPGEDSVGRAQHEYKYFHRYLWVHPWENMYKQITCLQVPGA